VSDLTRFAPAPTGFLHLGHVLNAHSVWTVARDRGARVLLRVEDHDRERCRPEYEAALLDDLDWLGFVPDLYPTDDFRRGRCESRQSDRAPIYEEAARELAARGRLYGCACSRADIARVAGMVGGADIARAKNTTGTADIERAKDTMGRAEIARALDDAGGSGEIAYPGTCRDLGLPLEPGMAWRVRIDPGDESFDDLLLGPQRQSPHLQSGDVVIRDRLGNWTYQFVASVDDFRQGIDLVVRGRDLLPSTGRQIQIARLLGRTEPAVFAHHQLIMKSPAQKLSKSDGDTGVRDLRAAGWTREDVISAALKT
jgi:glutamyl-Q tRNA(Asp) synthetase